MKLAIQLEQMKRENMDIALDRKQRELGIDLEQRKKELELEAAIQIEDTRNYSLSELKSIMKHR